MTAFVDGLLRTFFPRPPRGLSPIFHYNDTVLTPKRLANLHLLAAEYQRSALRPRALPIKLVIESTNVCNLECPACFTGVGENGRLRSSLTLDGFRKVMDELGDTLFDVEFYNWGEPLLNKAIFAMIADANARGVTTTISTNLSIPFDEEKAEQLVRSGLKFLGVSIDGSSQETYEQYRVGGKLDLVLKNCRMIVEAKRKLGSSSPRMIWIFHAFKHNLQDIPEVRALGQQIGFDEVSVSRGYTVDGEHWEPEGVPPAFTPFKGISPCAFLWQYAVVHNEGGVAPCCATFYQEDDVGRLALKPGDLGSGSFREVWTSDYMQHSRSLYKKGTGKPEARNSICEACPVTKSWQELQEHVAEGKPRASFKASVKPQDGPIFFFNWRPAGRDTKKPVRPERNKARAAKLDPVE